MNQAFLNANPDITLILHCDGAVSELCLKYAPYE